MRHNAILWTPRRATLKEMERTLAQALNVTLLRQTAVISPLFHSSPKYRTTTPSAMRLRVITLENGDYQLVHNPGDSNFDEIFDEWPRVIVYYAMQSRGLDAPATERHAVLECHDCDRNWEKAGWTSGTTMTFTDNPQDRHKILFGLTPWGWDDGAKLEAALATGGEALAKFLGGTCALEEDASGGLRNALRVIIENQGKVHDQPRDPMEEMRNIDDAEIGHL